MRRSPAVIALAGLVLLSACKQTPAAAPRLPGAEDQPPPAASPVPAPSGLITAGQLTVAIVPTLPVQQYLDTDGRPAGFDIDLIGAIASQMGVRISYFKLEREDDIVPGFVDPERKYDLGMADQVDSPALDNAAKTLPYFNTGQSLLLSARDARTASLDDLCGQSVGALRSSAAELVILRRNGGPCKDNKIDYQPYDDGTKAPQDLRDGTLKGYLDEYATVVFYNRVTPELRVMPHPGARAKEVMVFPLTDSAVHDAVAAALDRLQKDGTYAALLKKWGLDEGGL